ncbi:MAG: elongation factor G, partial [Culicoidibacterales bacterium]
MFSYSSDKIRNVILLGQSGFGKSYLKEAMSFTAHIDSTFVIPKEQSASTSLSLFSIPWQDHKYNFIDTPGASDFYAETKSAFTAIDSSIIVVDATSELQLGTHKAIEMTDEQGLPRFIFVNKIDDASANFSQLLQDLRDTYGKRIVPFHLPMDQPSFTGYINIAKMVASEFDAKAQACREISIPESYLADVAPLRELLLESVAETDLELFDLFLGGETLSDEQVQNGLRAGVLDGSLIPVLCGSTLHNIGVRTLLNMIWDYLPAPSDTQVVDDATVPFSGFVFKTIVDRFIGKISFLHVRSGALTPDTTITNITQATPDKIGKFYTYNKNELVEQTSAVAGDIVVLVKAATLNTNDTLSTDTNCAEFEPIVFPTAQLFVAIQPEKQNDDEKLSQALQKLQEEDPSIQLERNLETHQLLVGLQGELHFDALTQKLKEKFGVSITTEPLKIAYREAITKTVEVQGKHKKQSGGHGQYGDVKIRFSPIDTEFEFSEQIVGGSVPKNYIPAVEKGLRESLVKGVLAGFPVTNLKAVLFDGSYHDVDSSEMAFKTAAHIAFKDGLTQANPVLLEPVMDLTIFVPEQFTGDIIGDVTRKRGRVLGIDVHKQGKQQITAQIPYAELVHYAIELKAITQGQGFFKMAFNHYAQVPQALSD